ncbi:MAG: SDR family NAD(P)-dependent oxidoreductase [Candidatus Humimicrobiaceae bacterium]
MEKRFDQKVVLVIGAGSGIGESVAINFAKEGACLVLVNIFEKELNAVCENIKKIGNPCIAITADATKEEEVIRFTQEAVKSFGKIDILVNSAGNTIERSVIDMDVKQWDEVQNVNLRSIFLSTKETLKVMIKNNYGKIINIGSICSKRAFARGAAYCSSKFGVLGLTEASAAEVKNYNININAILPARTNTLMFRKYHPNHKDVKGLMEPADIAKVVLFFASEDAKAIKGTWLEVTNGQTLDDWDGVYYDWKESEKNISK